MSTEPNDRPPAPPTPRPPIDTMHLGMAGVAIEREIAAERIAELKAERDAILAWAIACASTSSFGRTAEDVAPDGSIVWSYWAESSVLPGGYSTGCRTAEEAIRKAAGLSEREERSP